MANHKKPTNKVKNQLLGARVSPETHVKAGLLVEQLCTTFSSLIRAVIAVLEEDKDFRKKVLEKLKENGETYAS